MSTYDYVLEGLSGYQDFLDWWQGPIGFMLPSSNQWDNYLIQSAAVSAAGSFLGPALTRYAERPVLRAAGTRVVSREIVKQTAKRFGIIRLAAVMTMSVPSPISVLFWTVVTAYSLPPTVNKHVGMPVGLPIFTGNGFNSQ